MHRAEPGRRGERDQGKGDNGVTKTGSPHHTAPITSLEWLDSVALTTAQLSGSWHPCFRPRKSRRQKKGNHDIPILYLITIILLDYNCRIRPTERIEESQCQKDNQTHNNIHSCINKKSKNIIDLQQQHCLSCMNL